MEWKDMRGGRQRNSQRRLGSLEAPHEGVQRWRRLLVRTSGCCDLSSPSPRPPSSTIGFPLSQASLLASRQALRQADRGSRVRARSESMQ